MKSSLTIIILNYNTKTLTTDLVKSLINTPYQIIVVDNASTEKFSLPQNLIKPNLKIISSDKNLGFAGGNNLALKQIKTPYILLLNSDVIVEPKTITESLKFIQSNPQIGAMTCKLVLPNGQLDPASHRGLPTPLNALTYFSGLEKLFPKNKFLSGYHQTWKDQEVPHQVGVISGAFFLFSKKVLDKVGLLDERFFMYGEDIDYCHRIKKAGLEVWYYPHCQATHLKKSSGRKSKNLQTNLKTKYHFFKTMLQYIYKWRSRP